MAQSLTTQIISATKWTYLATFVNVVLQVAVTAILARLLVPGAFGLVAMATLVLRFGQYFAQMGVGQAIVQRRDLSTAHVRAGMWTSVVLGAAFSAVVWAAAPLIAELFRSSQLQPVLRMMGLSFTLTGASAVAFALLRRDMRFKGIALADIAAYAIGYGLVGVSVALTGGGVWSLVSASLTQAATVCIIYNALARPSLTPVMSRRAYHELLGFGSTVSVISFLEFMSTNLDTMVVGRFAGSASLGLYSRALSLTGVPMEYLSTSLSKVLFPSFSRIQGDQDRFRKAYIATLAVAAGVGLPVSLGMSGAARELVAVLLGPQWGASVSVVRLAALASAAAVLSHFAGVALEATGRLREKLAVRGAQLGLFAGLLLLLGRFGLLGYALAFVLSEIAVHIALSWRMTKDFCMGRSAIISAYRPGLVGGVCACAALWGESWAGRWLGLGSGLVLVVQAATGAAVLLVAVLCVARGLVLREVASRGAGTVPGRVAARLVSWRYHGALGDTAEADV